MSKSLGNLVDPLQVGAEGGVCEKGGGTMVWLQEGGRTGRQAGSQSATAP
jgi:hypothetical protein